MNKQWADFINETKKLYGKDFVPLHEPTFSGNELKYVSDCIETGWVSSVGQYVNDFADHLAHFTGTKHAIPVVNGTAALHIALSVLDIGPGDEVLIPSLTFIATANAVHYTGAVPHFIDVNEVTLGVDPEKLEHYLMETTIQKEQKCINKLTGRTIKAIVPMHTFGHPVAIDEILAICEQFNIKLIEDAAESLGSYYKGKHTGSFGELGAISFNGNKIVTTGGGGAVITNDDELAKRLKHITTTAKLPHKWEFIHDEIGYNYRLPNLNAALGCAQLEKLPTMLEQKRKLVSFYESLIEPIEGVSLFKERSDVRSNYWLQTLVIDDELINRDELLALLNDNGIMSRPIWNPIHQLEMYKLCPRMDLSVTEKLKGKIINIPSTPVEVNK